MNVGEARPPCIIFLVLCLIQESVQSIYEALSPVADGLAENFRLELGEGVTYKLVFIQKNGGFFQKSRDAWQFLAVEARNIYQYSNYKFNGPGNPTPISAGSVKVKYQEIGLIDFNAHVRNTRKLLHALHARSALREID